jgi:hypothetical protein
MRHMLPFALVALVFLGGILFNRVEPFVLGVPTFVAWNIFSVVLISAGMWLVFKLDPANSRDELDS